MITNEEMPLNPSEEIEELDENQELYEHFRYEVHKGQNPLRVDKFLMNIMENVTRNKLQNAAKSGNILINGESVKSNYKVRPYDVVSLVLTFPPREIEINPEDIPITIVYEDDDVIIINKPSGMVVHPGFGNYKGTLLNALAFHFQQQNFEGQAYLVHRIDKDTTGLLIVAKNEESQAHLARQFFEHSIERKYNALVWGDFDNEEGTIVGSIARHPKNRKVMTVYPDNETGKHAVTHYKCLERFTYVTLIECVLETGRTHQIRAHLKHIKHPLFNDVTYGGDEIRHGTIFTKYKQFIKNCYNILPRQALHAKSLGFIHPRTQEWMFFESELPQDLQQVIEKWRIYAVHRIEYESE